MAITSAERDYIEIWTAHPNFSDWYKRYQYREHDIKPFWELTEQEQFDACRGFELSILEKWEKEKKK